MLEDAMKLKVRHLWLMLIVAAVLLLIAVAIHTASA
jgi:flagellar basal body-associated protein FliL